MLSFKTPLTLLLTLTLLSCPSFGKNQSNDDVAVAFELTAVVAGILAQKIHPESQIEMDVDIWLGAGGRLTGTTTPQSIRVYLDRNFSADSEFTAERAAPILSPTSRTLVGGISRTLSFGFSFRQLGENLYQIDRRLIGFGYQLELKLEQGHIQGQVYRSLALDWSVEGEISPSGEIEFEIQRPLAFDVTAKGKITPTALQIIAP